MGLGLGFNMFKKKRRRAMEKTMDVMLTVTILLGAAILGAWRLGSEFDRESKLKPAMESVKRADRSRYQE